MAIGKGRTNKRSSSSSSSSSSYTSTITTIIFIALCVLGLWLFTSNSVTQPRATTTKTTDDFVSDASVGNSHVGKSRIDRKVTPAFDDNPGDLPDDAIKTDEQKPEQEPEIQSDSGSDDSANENSNEEQSNNDKQETEQQNGEDESGDKNEEEQKSSEESASVLEEISEDPKGKESVEAQEEKQRENETQSSEESSVTENQQETNEQQKETETQSSEESSESQNQQEQPTETNDQDIQQTVNDESKNDDQENKNPEQIENDKETTDNSQESVEDSKPNVENQQEQENQETQRTDNNEDNISNQQEQENHDTQQTDNEENKNQLKDDQESTNEEQNQNDKETTENSLDSDEDSKQKLENQKQQQQQNQVDNLNTEQPKTDDTMGDDKSSESNSGETFPSGENSGIPKESKESKKSWSTQADQSENEKERRKDGSANGNNNDSIYGYTWQLCNVTAGKDYIPCLDNEKFLSVFHKRKNHEHRERHCPDEAPTCLVPVPEGYKRPIEWPRSRDKIWYHNVPNTKLAEVKGHQNWVKVTGEYLTFPGGGTQFIHGALHYIDFVQQSVPRIGWGRNTRVILDVGCGVASFGGYLFERGVLAMSFAPKDEHEAQVQFALERGIPAISAVMGSQRLPFPSRVFDLVHCARCRVPWHDNGGALLLELNRVLRPGGHFVWSATPVYQKLEEDVEIWRAMSMLTASMCWELVTIKRDKLNSVGAAIYRKPNTNDCYDQRRKNQPPMCKSDDDPNAAWYVPIEACMHRAPVGAKERGKRWPESWPARIQTTPYWLNSSQMGIYGKPAPLDFAKDYEHWKSVVNKLYLNGLGINWSNVRNVMDMRAVYGGFAAALKDLQVWVFNVVNVDSPDTLPIIYERGLFGIYHDWCESFSTYPRTYDLLHADHLFSRVKKRCKIVPLMAEIDRIVRPGGKLIVRDDSSTVGEVENLLKSLHWEINLTFSKDQEGILSARKTDWRPETYEASS